MIEKRKEEQETLLMEQEKEEERRRTLAAREAEIAEEKRRREDAARREVREPSIALMGCVVEGGCRGVLRWDDDWHGRGVCAPMVVAVL
jgi:hypothetical protein